jgi:hypothetical protein
VQYISGYDSQGNPIYSTYNYTAYGQWSWNNGNNGTWSAPSCNNPGPGNASPPPAQPSCGAGQTETAAPTWNGAQWVGLQCSAPPQQQPTGSGSTQPTGGGQGNSAPGSQNQPNQNPQPTADPICTGGPTNDKYLPDGTWIYNETIWEYDLVYLWQCPDGSWGITKYDNAMYYYYSSAPESVMKATGGIAGVDTGGG